MLADIAKKIFGTGNDRFIKKLRPIVNRVNEFEPEMKKLTQEELARRFQLTRSQVNYAISQIRRAQYRHSLLANWLPKRHSDT